MKRSTSFNIMKPINEKNLGWKPKKVSEPDVGTYEIEKPITFIKEKHPSYLFPKSKSLKFTVEYSN